MFAILIQLPNKVNIHTCQTSDYLLMHVKKRPESNQTKLQAAEVSGLGQLPVCDCGMIFCSLAENPEGQHLSMSS